MTTQPEPSRTGLTACIEERRARIRAFRRRGKLVALGLAGMAYDQVRARLHRTNDWLDRLVQRGEQTEQDLADIRHELRTRVDASLEKVQERGAAFQEEARAALNKVVASPAPIQEDIPVTAAEREDTAPSAA